MREKKGEIVSSHSIDKSKVIKSSGDIENYDNLKNTDVKESIQKYESIIPEQNKRNEIKSNTDNILPVGFFDDPFQGDFYLIYLINSHCYC